MVRIQRKRKRLPLVGSRIRELRKDRSLTQSELAARVGIQQSDLCRMETGEYKVSLETLFKILSIFRMNIAEFFHEQVPHPPSGQETEILVLFRRLEQKEQEEVLDFLRFKVHQLDAGLEEGDDSHDDEEEVDQGRPGL